MAHDMSGMQRSGDVDYPDFYTLNSGGMINSFLENMEQINVNTGAKENEAGAETSSGKVLMPNSGSGRPAWGNMDVMVMRVERLWSLPDCSIKEQSSGGSLPGLWDILPLTRTCHSGVIRTNKKATTMVAFITSLI